MFVAQLSLEMLSVQSFAVSLLAIMMLLLLVKAAIVVILIRSVVDGGIEFRKRGHCEFDHADARNTKHENAKMTG